MKIEIDTQRDSKEELKKLAKSLHELGDGSILTNQGSGIFDDSNNDNGNLLGMFGDDKTSNNTSTPLNSLLETVHDDSEETKSDQEEKTELEFY